ncbi:MAG: protein kinase domain-containing protein [Candidatus Acidiferrales bacterium]
MTPERWQEVKQVLAEALEKAPAERSAYLDATCADAGLRREVESLLDAYQRGDRSSLEEPTLTTESSQAPKSGDRLGPYEIVARIGAGGMGEVYRARDHRLERDVAIKIFAPWRRIDDSSRRRFRREALALAKLNHPNIASVYDVGEQDGRDYLVMEYVPGQSLAEKVKSGPLPPAEALSLGEEIALALQEAHEHKIIHRDLKPANVILTPKGHAKVLDFGLAKLLAQEDVGDVTLSVPETVGPVGTPLYMSPEQTEGKAVDSRTDVWSLGVVLYELLAGSPPFDRRGGMALLRAIAEEKEKPLRGVRPDVSAETERIVSRALEKDASKRYQSASEMARDLSSELSKISAPQVPGARREVRLSVGYAIAGALAVIAVFAAGAWLYHRSAQREWARDTAIPEIAKLQDQRKALAAYLLLQKAERILPGDAHLAQLAAQNTAVVSITSSPPGATIEIKDYLSPASAWYRLGTTPLNNLQIPPGYFRWRVSKQGVGEYLAAPPTQPKMNFELDKEMIAPTGMSWVGAGSFENFIGFVGMVGPYQIPAFYIDRYEVTNREYQKFVDAGGYEKRQYWTGKFVRDGHEMKWEDAMALFRDGAGARDRPRGRAATFRPGKANTRSPE